MTIADEAQKWLAEGAPERPGLVIVDEHGVSWVRGPEGRYVALRPAAPTTYRATMDRTQVPVIDAWAVVLPLVVLMALILAAVA